MAADETFVYVLISNIPESYHSSDLRDFFSQLIETSRFHCFHFRHRPQLHLPSTLLKGNNEEDTRQKRTTCCVVRVEGVSAANELKQKYHGKHWLDKDGSTLCSKCLISKVKIAQKGDNTENGNVSLTQDDLNGLLELRPPPLMPNGNVGTPTKIFLELIRACRLPPNLIPKLGLQFPRCKAGRLYSKVPMDYGAPRINCRTGNRKEERTRSGSGRLLTDRMRTKLSLPPAEESPQSDPEQQRHSESEEDDECEEWDRHEALHDDVDEQGRNKERLFEEEIELKWEKGGSGLVFYTDAQFWTEKDFDEKTADDWDIDTSVYYEKDGGDKDARDLLSIRREARHYVDEIGAFERHTKGIGRKVLEKQGWREGQGVGRTQGIPEPIQDTGQCPWDKKGFGYRGEKLSQHRRKRRRSVTISTIYDDPLGTDPEEPLLRSGPPTRLKFRPSKPS